MGYRDHEKAISFRAPRDNDDNDEGPKSESKTVDKQA